MAQPQDHESRIALNKKTWQAMLDVDTELQRARKLHPGNEHMLAALMEEVGELAKALLEGGNGKASREEAMHVACVAIRIMIECDADFCGGAA